MKRTGVVLRRLKNAAEFLPPSSGELSADAAGLRYSQVDVSEVVAGVTDPAAALGFFGL